MSDILQVQKTPILDTAITRVETQILNPNNPQALSNNDVIRFNYQQSDTLAWLERSYFLVSGRLAKKKEDGTLTASTVTKFANGGILFLFNRAELKINNLTIEQVLEPGLTCIPKIYTTHNEWSARYLALMGWGETLKTDENGYFYNALIPFKTIFSLGEDYKQVLINPSMEVLLSRNRNDDNVIIQSAAEDYDLNISKIQLCVPFVTTDDTNRLNILKIIDENKGLPIIYRPWDLHVFPLVPASKKQSWTIKTTSQLEKARYVIFFLQTKRLDDPLKDATKYDHCDMCKFVVIVNGVRFSNENIDQSFKKNNFSVFYHNTAEFSATYNGMTDAVPLLDLQTFKTDAPIFVVDCSRQNEAIKYGPVDVSVEFEANEPFPPGTSAYCIIVHDAVFQYHPLTREIRKYEG